jgi:DNA-binding CsgD family transcriptional regulator
MKSRDISTDRSIIASALRLRGRTFREIAVIMRIGPDRARTYVARGERLRSIQHHKSRIQNSK